MAESEITKERRRFRRKARNAIEATGDMLTRDERVRLVKSIATDYNPLPPTIADAFIGDFPHLIDHGWDEETAPEKRPQQ